MRTPARFRVEERYKDKQEGKANTNPLVMAVVGLGDGGTVATGRANFCWIRLVNDQNRLTQCYHILPLTYGDYIYVRRAKDRKLTYYEFVEWIRDAGGGTVPPTYHNLLSATHLDTTAATPPGRGSVVTGQGAAPSNWAELVRSTQGFFFKDDGTDVNWFRLAQHTVHVGPGTECEANTLGAAVGLVVGAGAANPWVILVDSIVTAEVGNVTIPEHCDVVGRGENSTIGLGANRIIFNSNCGLEQLHVISSDANYAMDCNAVTDVFLRDVHVENTSTGGALYVHGASATLEAQDCIFEATDDGWCVCTNDTADVLLDHCRLEAATGDISIGLYLLGDSTVTTRYCHIVGDTDVNVASADATWTYCDDDFDYRYCTITGTAQPADGQPVIWFDYTVAAANAAAITNAINWVKGRTRVGDYIIDVAAGSHDVGLTFIDIPDEGGSGNVILQGDTRILANLSYVSGPQTAAAWAPATPYVAGNIVQPTAPNNFYYKATDGGTSAGAEPAWPTTLNATVVDNPGVNQITWICCGIPNNRAGLANGGVQDGVCMIAVAGNNITVTMTTQVTGVVSNPNFAADGWQNGDTIIAMDNAGAIAVHTITGVAANVITIGAGAPAMGNLGTAFTLLSNRAIARTAAGPCITNHVSGVQIKGIYLDTATGANCHGVDAQNGYMELENVAIRAEDTGINLHNDASVKGDGGALSLVECYYGVSTLEDGVGARVTYAIAYKMGHTFVRASHGYINAEYCIASKVTQNGFFVGESENLLANYAYALNCSYGFLARFVGSMNAIYAVAEGCTTAGFATLYFGGMMCDWSAARNCLRGYWGYYNSYMFATNTVNNCAGNTTNHSPAATDTEGNVAAIITFT